MSSVVPLHADRGEDEAALLVHVTGVRHVGGRLSVAAVGLMRLRGRREDVSAFPEDGHEDDVVGRVGVAEIRVVVQERVAFGQVVVQVGDGLGEELHPDHVHREALGRREQAVVGRDQRAGEVACHVEHRGATGAQQRVLHLAHDRVEAVGDDGERHGVEGAHRASSRTALSDRSVPLSVASSRR